MNKTSLSETTILAEKEERQRKERILERQKKVKLHEKPFLFELKTAAFPVQQHIRKSGPEERQSGQSGARLRRAIARGTPHRRPGNGPAFEAAPSQGRAVHVQRLLRVPRTSQELQGVRLHPGPLHGLGKNATSKTATRPRTESMQ